MRHALLQSRIGESLADDAEMLAWIHSREIAPSMLLELRAIGFPDNLALLPNGSRAKEAWTAMRSAIGPLPQDGQEQAFDQLAADYAAIYLTAAYGVSPCESAWFDDDHLVCQDAMFQLREIYRAAGLCAADWRRRPDDHLVLQLAYISHAVRSVKNLDDWRGIARVMDEHLLRWLPEFAARIAHRCETAFYAGLAVLTIAWCDEFRDLIAAQLDEPRPSREEIELRLQPARHADAVPLNFMPGIGPTV
jgi:TorA maturation chaperone TorD